MSSPFAPVERLVRASSQSESSSKSWSEKGRHLVRRGAIAGLVVHMLLTGCAPDAIAPTPRPGTQPAIIIPPPPTSPVTPGAVQGTPIATPTPAFVVESGVSVLPPPTSPVTPEGLVSLSTTTPSPGPGSLLVYAGPEIPAGVLAAIDELMRAQPGRLSWTNDESEADLRLVVGNGTPIAEWTYALAAPFPTIIDEVTFEEVLEKWRSGALVLTDADALLLAALWGEPEVESATVPESELIETLWNVQQAWTVRPFDLLTPELKVLRVEDDSPLDADFRPGDYALQVPISIIGNEQASADFRAAATSALVNRDPAKLTHVAMTGVTALVRATAYQMELNGILYPGEEVAPILQRADIAHISNEVAFAPDCPAPNPVGGTTFCSSEAYFALLEALGTDVVEVTGNHVNDWGTENFTATLELYENAGMAYFGGGRNLEDGAGAALFRHNDNHIAFVGCNPVGPAYAWSSAASAGSQPCDYAALYEQIAQLRDEGFVVIATQQYQELYSYTPSGQQVIDFAALADAGAAAVSGSQGHHAQGFAFHEGSFIHYGLGNLFFDQMDMTGTRQTFVDIYTIYSGQLLSVELWTGLIENYARPRLMTADERASLLQSVFQASGW